MSSGFVLTPAARQRQLSTLQYVQHQQLRRPISHRVPEAFAQEPRLPCPTMPHFHCLSPLDYIRVDFPPL